MIPAVEAHINTEAFRHNLERVREAAPGKRVIAVIKADGYGHGLLRSARALAAADAYGVARIEEALELRAAGLQHPVVVLAGVLDSIALQQAAEYGLQIVVHHRYQLEMLERSRITTPLTVWLKVDTGMHRLGVAPAEVGGYWKRLQACAAVAEVKFMTHLACADDRDSGNTAAQLQCFAQVLSGRSGECSIANSAGLLGWPEGQGDWVRPGIMLYGVSPFIDEEGSDQGLRPVMTLKSRLIAINQFKKGDAIGYGASWRCPEDMPVGVVACGYGDGYPRHACPGTPVLVNGQAASLIGRVSMDTLCIDLRGCSGASIGDEVTLWGQGLAVERVAAGASTIAYELLCSITRRVRVVEHG